MRISFSLSAILLVAPFLHAANGFVQLGSCVNQAAASLTCSITFGSNMTAGNTVTVHLQTNPVSPQIVPVPTITGAICWPLRTFDVDITQNINQVFLNSWVCPNVPGGTTGVTVTVANQNGASNTAFAIEWSGLGTWPTFTNSANTWPSYGAGGGFASGTNSTMSVTSNTNSGDLVIAFGGQQSPSSGASCTSANLTQPGGGSIANTNSLACIQYNLSSSGGATSASQVTGAAKAWGYQMVALHNASTQYLPTPTQSNGMFVQKSAVTPFTQHALTDAFPTLVNLPNGNIGMAYEQESDGGQGSGPHSTAAFAYTTNGGSTWTDYSGTTYGSDCTTQAIAGCVFSGDGLNADSHWFNGYAGLTVVGSTVYYTITAETNTGSCVKAQLSTSTNSGVQFGTPITVDSNSACWIGPLISVPSGGGSSLCPSGCLIAPISDNGTAKFFTSTDGGSTWPSSTTITPSILFDQFEDYVWYGGSNILNVVGRSICGQPLRWGQTTDFGTTWTTGYTNVITSLSNIFSVCWQLTSPTVINPGTSDGNLSLLYWDRNSAQMRLINFPLNTLLTNAMTLGLGQVTTQAASSQVEGYQTICNISGNKFLLAWYAPSQGNSSNGQLYTMQGTYISPAYAPFAMHR